MQPNQLIIFTGLTFLFLLASLSFHDTSAAPPHEPPTKNQGLATIITPTNIPIFAEIADTPEKRTKGLMDRTSLASNRGMLFTFSDFGYWTFWMKNTKVSLDIIWLNKNGTIVDIQQHVPICKRKDNGCPRYTPSQKALFVLELKAGQAKKFQLKRGVQLNIQMPHLPHK